MLLSGRPRRKGRIPPGVSTTEAAVPVQVGDVLREFVYLDEASVQSLLVSLTGTLPSEITTLTSRSTEAELAGTVGASTPLIKAELTSRFKGSSASSSQVLSRAVAESLFKHLYELIDKRLVLSPSRAVDAAPVSVERGDLVEILVELAPDPIYSFNATLGVLSDIADDYPPLLQDKTTAMILAEAGPVNKVLERLLVGLIPIKAKAIDLNAGEIDGKVLVAPRQYFETGGIEGSPVSIVGVTEQEKYWRDVRRVLFSGSTFTVLGRISRSGVHSSWTPVKLTEVMREIAPAFPDAITRAGQVGFSQPINNREEANRDALERALTHYALAAGGDAATARREEVAQFAQSMRDRAESLSQQGKAFDALNAWLVEAEIIAAVPENARLLRSEARHASDLKSNSAVTSLSDFASSALQEEPPAESLIDLEIVAIYW